ncbi:MAG: hypothetical protein ACRCWG_11475 [Sarcina sp.]
MKDEINFKDFQSLIEVTEAIDDYNNHRCQWN